MLSNKYVPSDSSLPLPAAHHGTISPNSEEWGGCKWICVLPLLNWSIYWDMVRTRTKTYFVIELHFVNVVCKWYSLWMLLTIDLLASAWSRWEWIRVLSLPIVSFYWSKFCAMRHKYAFCYCSSCQSLKFTRRGTRKLLSLGCPKSNSGDHAVKSSFFNVNLLPLISSNSLLQLCFVFWVHEERYSELEVFKSQPRLPRTLTNVLV